MSTRYTAAPYVVPVVIIGSSPAGLAASKVLQDAGVPSLLLEASGQLGGQLPAIARYISDFALHKRVHTHAPVWDIAQRRDGTFCVSYTHYGKPQQVVAASVVIAAAHEHGLAWLDEHLQRRLRAAPVAGLLIQDAELPTEPSLTALEQQARAVVAHAIPRPRAVAV